MTSVIELIPSHRHILDTFITQSDGKQIIGHQIESFNQFMEVDIPEIIHMANPIMSYGSPEIPLAGPRSALATATGLSTSAANALMGTAADGTAIAAGKKVKHEYEVTLEFEKISIRKPTIFENNGAIHPMMPQDARLRNLTYASPLNVDVKVITTFIDHTRNSIRESNVRIFPNVHLGKVPVMVGSKYCLLHDQKHIHPSNLGECAEDLGGYFIIQGGERAMISMERMSENRPFVFRNGRANAKEMEVVEIKCIGPDNDQVPKSNTVKIVYHPKNQLITMLRATVPRIKTEIPIVILFRALGVLADKDIYELIVGYDNDPTYDHIITETILEASSITTQEQALAWIGEHINTWSVKSQKQSNVQDVIGEELFPQIGGKEMNYEKACFLAHMARKVLWTSSKRLPTDDRDGYPNKRVDIPGFLLADLFRKTYNNRMVKDMKAALSKEIHGGSWKATGNWTEIVNINNINKIIKSTILDVCLKSSLATGNFGSGKIGGPSKIGVSQVLNRLNYTSAISHLRRISTPIEKTGKLIAPRKQHNTQWGYICPCETPEGHGVGVIKNMASTAVISIFSSPITVYALIQNLDKLVSLRIATIQQKHDNTRVFLNGSWIGILPNEDASYVVDELRKAKRSGKIHIYTGIIWKNAFKELWITTEAGRILRPVYYAPAIREIASDKSGKIKQDILNIKEWNQLMLWETPQENHLFEYLDAGETEGSYIAMDYDSCVNDSSYTHCEIHPSIVFGTAASGIPFPDHNQSPRNAYQCLGIDEKVRMADGTEKRIADVKIGDDVITFNPTTKEITTTKVCNQYVRTTDKKIYKLIVSGNRSLIATEDHKLMTNQGWVQVKDIIPGIHLIGVMAEPSSVININNESNIILSEEDFKNNATKAGIHDSMINTHIDILKGSNLLPLKSTDKRLPIISRMIGFTSSDGSLNVFTKNKTVNNNTYIYSLPQFQAHFGSHQSAERFENDILQLSLSPVSIRESHREFKGSIRHTYCVSHNGALPTLLIALGTTIGKKTDVVRLPVPYWIMNGSELIKREFLSGFQGGDGCKFRANIIKNYVSINCNTTSQQANPITVTSLEKFFNQIVELFKHIGVDAHMLKNKVINDNRIEVRYIFEGSRQNLLNYWDKVGFKYDTFKQQSSAVIAELIRELGPNTVIRPEHWEQWRNTCYSMGAAVFVPIKSVEITTETNTISDITVLHDNHSFITSGGILSSNCAMGKQAMGIYSLNFRERFDAMSHVLCYPEIPMVSPYMSKFYGAQSLPAGQNIVVAIMTYTGYNQEDSNMINKAALDRGRFRSIFYRTYKDEERKNQSSGEEEKFCNPDTVETKHMKNAHYDKVAEDGFVPKDQYVTPDDVLIGKVVPLRVATGAVLPAGAKKQRDVSKMPRNNESGYVDKIYKNRNGEGYNFVKIRMRQDRIPEIGDKFCLTPDHDVMTRTRGWVPIVDVTMDDEVAQLNKNTGYMEYVKPHEILSFDHDGNLYEVESQGVSLRTTLNHRMWVQRRDKPNYELIKAEDIIGKRVRYQSDGAINTEDYELTIGDIKFTEEKMDALLMICGIWMAEGWTYISEKDYIYRLEFAANKPRVQEALKNACDIIGLKYNLVESSLKFYINHRAFTEHLSVYSVGATNKSVPLWAFELSARQSRIFISGMCLGDGHETPTSLHYSTSSIRLRDNLQILCQHAGYTSYYAKRYDVGHSTKMSDGRIITTTAINWDIGIRRTRLRPTINHGHTNEQNGQSEILAPYTGKVYCLRVPTEVFLVRRHGRIVWTGNSSRHGQKGTMGMIINQEDMPQTATGIVPDIIINPHCIPSRMTIAQLMETLLSKIGCMTGCLGDGSPFNNVTVDNLSETLRDKFGMEPYGNEIMYNGYTGRMMETSIFIGPCYYQRLRHCSADKMHSRASGPLVMLTRQPAEGRAREGGLRFGEMERDCVVAHGMAEFTKERLMECSDLFSCYSCKDCGLLAIANPEQSIWACRGCGNSTNFSHINIPYATKLLLQELETMNLGSRLITQQKLICNDTTTK